MAAMDDPFDLPPDVLKRIPLFRELSKVLSWTSGPVNWDLARQIATSLAAAENAPAAPAEDVSDNVRVAEMWLADATGIPAGAHLVAARGVQPVDWAEHATVAFAELIDPIAAKLQRALSDSTGATDNPIAAAVGQLTPMFMGMQAGTIVGTLAQEITGTYELGLPAYDDALLLVTSSIDAIADAEGIERRAAHQWVALLAAAHRAIYEGFPFVRAQFFSSYHDYVSSLDVDIADGLARLGSLDLTDPSRLQDILGNENLFAPQPSAATAAAAERVTRLLSLVDAHARAAASFAGVRLGDVTRMSTVFSRGGLRGAQMLDAFIGLDRSEGRAQAASFAGDVVSRAGWNALNAMWEEADALPTADELRDASAWLARVTP
jgi:putative hydrolase